MISPEHPNGLTVDPDVKRRLAIAVGVCPYCKRNLSDPMQHGERRYRHCYSCHFDFYLEDTDEQH